MFAEAAAARGVALEERSLALGPPPDDPLGYDAVLVLGGSANVGEEDRHPWMGEEKALIAELLDRERPLLGVCLGAQLVADVAGGRVARLERPEIGWHDVELDPAAAADPLLADAPPRLRALQWHSFGFALPPGAAALARSDAGMQAYRIGERAWGLQFHAEVTAATLARWLELHGGDGDAERAGLRREGVAAEAEREMVRWNAFGRELFGRFLAASARRS